MTIRYFSIVTLYAVLTGTANAQGGSASTDVSAYGATGNGYTDDTNALQTAINATPSGGTLTFGGPTQVYLISSQLVFQPNKTYQGQGTIRMNMSTPPHTPIGVMQYGAAANVTINGITFDSNGVGGGLQIAVGGAGAIPASGIQLNHLVFRNTIAAPAGAWDGAIYDSVGLINSQITNNQIVNCAVGMYLTNPNSSTIANNFFQTVHVGDAIDIVFNAAPFTYGQSIQITGNTGQHLGRMGIELWPSGGDTAQTSTIQGAYIAGNTFTQWDTGYNGDTFGISIMAGTSATVTNNKLDGPPSGYGIEVGSPQSTISQNSVNGFGTGIVLHDSSNTVVNGNLLSDPTFDGIEFSNAPGNRTNVIVQNNSIIDAQSFGIFVNTSTWGGASLSGNFISRTAGVYAADQSQLYTGISITPPVTPVSVTGNSITQAGVTGPSGFAFFGIRVNGGEGSNSSSTYQNNTILSQLMLSQSIGLFVNSTGALDGATLQGNTFTGLNAATGGAPSNGAISSGNMVYNCVMVGPIAMI